MDSCTCSLAFASSTPFSFICSSVILETVLRMCAGINFCGDASASLCVSCGGDDDAFAAIFRPTRRVVRCGLWEWRLCTFPTQSGFAFDRETTAALVVDRTKPAEEDMWCISKRVLPEEGTFQTRRRKAFGSKTAVGRIEVWKRIYEDIFVIQTFLQFSVTVS